MNNAGKLLSEEFIRSLKSFIVKRVANRQDAEDIMQDVYYRTLRQLDTLKETDKARAWAFQIARNTISDYYRTRRLSEPLEGIADREAVEAEDNNNREIAGCLPAMVDHLPAKDREALMLTEYQGLTHKEMAALLGLSLSGAKSRVQRARRKLRKLLCECCSLELDNRGNIIDYKLKEKKNPFCDLS